MHSETELFAVELRAGQREVDCKPDCGVCKRGVHRRRRRRRDRREDKAALRRNPELV